MTGRTRSAVPTLPPTFTCAQVHTRASAHRHTHTCPRTPEPSFAPANSRPVAASFAFVTRKGQGPGSAPPRTCHVVEKTCLPPLQRLGLRPAANPGLPALPHAGEVPRLLLGSEGRAAGRSESLLRGVQGSRSGWSGSLSRVQHQPEASPKSGLDLD